MSATLLLALAFSPAPTAIIDDVLGHPTLTPLQLLVPGDTLELGDTTRIRLAYFASCVHETVRGGRLRVGVTASIAVDGDLERITADCEPPPIRAGSGPDGPVGALVLRNARRPAPEPVLRLRTTSPVLVGQPGTRFRMTRVRPGGHQLFATVFDGLLRMGTLDIALEPDAVYRFCVDLRCVRVWVDPDAAHEHGPVLERIVRLP